MIEEHARRTMQLRHDDTLGAVDDEGPCFGHQGQIAHIDFLLLDVFDGLHFGGAFLVINDQADFHAQRRPVGHAPKFAFLHIEHRHTELVAYVFERSVT